MMAFPTFACGLACSVVTAVAAAFTVPLPVLVLSYLACFVIGFLLGHWQRSNEP